MHDKTDSVKETVFQRIANRESKYYKHSGILWWSNWEEVPKGTKGGFFRGTVLSEADINFSLDIYYVCDVYTVLDTVARVGAIVIAVIVIVDATPVVLANIQGIIYYCKTYGIFEGLKMYTYLGIQNLPNGVITWIQMDMADGDSSVDDLIDKGIPIYQRGITGEQALKISHPGESQKFFTTFVDGIKGGRYIDQYANNIAYESKVGYTCLSSRIRLQILKDAWLVDNGYVDAVVWEFFRSDITGRIGATSQLLELLKSKGIEYIIHF